MSSGSNPNPRPRPAKADKYAKKPLPDLPPAPTRSLPPRGKFPKEMKKRPSKKHGKEPVSITAKSKKAKVKKNRTLQRIGSESAVLKEKEKEKEKNNQKKSRKKQESDKLIRRSAADMEAPESDDLETSEEEVDSSEETKEESPAPKKKQRKRTFHIKQVRNSGHMRQESQSISHLPHSSSLPRSYHAPPVKVVPSRIGPRVSEENVNKAKQQNAPLSHIHQYSYSTNNLHRALQNQTAAIHRAGAKSKNNNSTDSNMSASSSSTQDGVESALETALEKPKVAKKWIKGDLLGVGAFGKVYKGYNKDTKQIIAIKEMIHDKKEDVIAELEKEAKILCDLRHDNIVNVLDYHTTSKKFYIIMEYVAGNSIDTILKKYGVFSEKSIANYTRQILKGLNYVHSQKVIHRDIKSKNVLVDNNHVVKIADFGSAKQVISSQSGATNPQLIASADFGATPLWTAPEVLTGTYNSKIDLWSVGCVVVEMATAKYPWSECNFQNPFAALYQIGSTDKLPAWPKSLSKECQDFLQCCLVRDPRDRYTAHELLQHPFLRRG